MEVFENRVAVVTGGGSGIGRGMALAFADAGTHVVVADIQAAAARSVADEVRKRGVRALDVQTDVSQRTSVEALAEQAYAEFGAVHILCNNAGVATMGTLDRCSDEDWRRILSVNLYGVINGLQAFLPRILAQDDEAHIVNTGSLCSLASYPLYGIYTTAKYALAGLTEGLRLDLVRHGVGVSLLCPGSVRTPLFEGVLQAGQEIPELAEAVAETRKLLDAGMDPLEVGRVVVEGIRHNDAYILTHPELKGVVEVRFRKIREAFDQATAREAERAGLHARAETGSGDLRGRIAVVTGGGSGIGRGMALAFADEGMHVVIADIEADAAAKVESEVRERGVRGLALRADVTEIASMREVAERTYSEFGAAHLLCNNAGVFVSGVLQDRTDADWDWVLSVNLYGVINGIQAFVPRMIAQGGDAHIVNTASIVGLMFSPSSGIYGSSKHGVVGLSESLALDLEPHGIGVSVLCPGGVRTRIMESARNRPAALADTRPDPITDKFAAEAIESGMEAVDVGRIVVDAIRRKDLYILPQPAARPFVEQRIDQILAAFDTAAARPRG